jgi:hypothetical protein
MKHCNEMLADNEAEVEATLKHLADASARLDALLAAAQQGSGTVGRLLADPALYEEVLQLVQNWRRKGIFYKERDKKPAPAQSGGTPSANFSPVRPAVPTSP